MDCQHSTSRKFKMSDVYSQNDGSYFLGLSRNDCAGLFWTALNSEHLALQYSTSLEKFWETIRRVRYKKYLHDIKLSYENEIDLGYDSWMLYYHELNNQETLRWLEYFIYGKLWELIRVKKINERIFFYLF